MRSLQAVRVAAVVLAVPQMVTGAWAAFWPSHWYERFPGFGPLLVAAEPPYNAHLATDAGAGFLATGVVLALAAWSGGVRELRLASLAYLVFAAAHFGYHVTHPAPGLSASEDLANSILLGAAVALPALMIWLLGARRETT